jgi:hypothetical protein
MKIAINTQTSGKFRRERINNRDHIVTSMIAIVGDSIMNGLLYPDDEVASSFEQLNQLPAPNGHPSVNGINISAFHPLAVNANNIGAFVANPTKSDKYVINELWVDESIANQSEDGKELISRIETGKQVGVSTGLRMQKIETPGDLNGITYNAIGKDFKFDHVAILLNEKPAGAETYLLNEDGSLARDEEIFLVNQVDTNEFSVRSTKEQLFELLNAEFPERFVFIEDCVAEDGNSGRVIYEVGSGFFQRSFNVDDDGLVSIEDDQVPVRKKVEFIELDDGDVSNNSNQPEKDMGDKSKKEAPTVEDVTNKGEITVESAIEFLEQKGMVVNSKQEDDDAKFFAENKGKITILLANEDSRLGEMRKNIVANSGLTDEDVADMDEPMLVRLAGSFKTNDYSMQGGGADVLNSGEEHLDSYAPTYDDAEVH